MIRINIENEVKYLQSQMPKVGDTYRMLDRYNDEETAALQKEGFSFRRYDFGVEMIEFTRTF